MAFDDWSDGSVWDDDPWGELLEEQLEERIPVGGELYTSEEVGFAAELLRGTPLKFDKIAQLKDGDVFDVTRKKGDAKVGRIQWERINSKKGEWRFIPNFNFKFNVLEIEAILEFIRNQI